MAKPAVTMSPDVVVTALFRQPQDAERAFATVSQLGYDNTHINVLMAEETRQRYLQTQGANSALARKASEPAPETSKSAETLGGPAGGTLGTVAPIVGAVGAALLIPGLGLAVAGPIAVALTAAGAVGVATGLIGALTHWGIPKDQAEKYEAGIRHGGIVIGVTARSLDDAGVIADRWRTSGGEMIDTRS